MKSFMFMFATSVRATTIEITDSNFRLEAGGKINAATGELEIPHGNGFAETTKFFKRPLEVSVMMKQDNTKGGHWWEKYAECGVLQVFPQRFNVRHTGYNAGTNWWHSHFGAGVDGNIGKEGLMLTNGKNMQYEWNEVKIRALEDGTVEFYLNGQLRKTVSDHQYQNGFIRMGYGCRHYRFKDLVVNSLVANLDHGMQMIPISDTHWSTAHGGQIRQGELYTNGGWASIQSKQTFTAPLKVSVMMKQDAGANNHAECGVLSVFPQHWNHRHTGYNAGTNWWHNQFGAGNDGAIAGRGSMWAHGQNMQLQWNKVSIDVNEDGHVYYYFNDILRHTERHAHYQQGSIRMGLGCRNYHFKDITVEKPLPTQQFVQKLLINSENFQVMNGAQFKGAMLNVNHGHGYVETYQNFQRPFSVSVMMKQDESVDWHHAHRPECGVIQVFPQNNNRHTGYNAGTNWWAHQFGAGVDGNIGGRGGMHGRELEWNEVEVKVLLQRVEFYMNGKLMYTAYDKKYREGTIRMGYGCRTFHFKDFMIYTDKKPTSAPTESPTNFPTAYPTAYPTDSPTKYPTAYPTDSPTKFPTKSPTQAPTQSPTQSPTERCDANNCVNWSCADWCECYDESKLSVYESHVECQDDNDDTCICFDNEEHELNGERHRKINYNQDAVNAGTAKMIEGTNIHAATKQHHYQEAGATTTNPTTNPPTDKPAVVGPPVEFVGCYNTGLIPGWSPWSCDPNADTFYYKCNRMHGSYDAMVEECANTCRSRGATQFDLHDRTACFCGTANNVAPPPPITDLAAAKASRCKNYLYRLNPPSPEEGPVHEWDRTQCGYNILGKESCEKQDCLWGELNQGSSNPWCYNKFKNKCAVNGDARQDCKHANLDHWRDDGHKRSQCENAGCCWQPSDVPGRPWCFHSK